MRIPDYTALVAPHADDVVPVVDTHDLSMSPAGTTKQATVAALQAAPQSFALANNTYKTLETWTVTGQTDDPLAGFGIVAGSQTYQRTGYPAIQGPAFWFGYNPVYLSGQANPTGTAHGAMGMSCFGDAGDTNNGAGGHGLEWNMGSFVSPSGSKATNAIQVVAADDNTNTVTLSLRCGTGSSNGVSSIISLSNADGTVNFMNMLATGSPAISVNQPTNFVTSSVNQQASAAIANTWNTSVGNTYWQVSTSANSAIAQLQLAATGTSSSAYLYLSGTSASVASSIFFQLAGTLKWGVAHIDPYLIFINETAGAWHMLFQPGSTYNAAQTWFLSQVFCYDNVVVNNAGSALATNATHGFLYLSTCPGTPSGTPQANAGSAPVVLDSTNGKLWANFTGSAWTTTLNQDPLGLGVTANFTTDTVGAFLNVTAANDGWFMRLRSGGYAISSLNISVGVSSGNVCVAAYTGSGSGQGQAPNGGQLATSGSVATPASGVAAVSLGATVTPKLADWVALACSNTTATFMAVGNTAGVTGYVNTAWAGALLSVMPLPASPGALFADSLGFFLMRGS